MDSMRQVAEATLSVGMALSIQQSLERYISLSRRDAPVGSRLYAREVEMREHGMAIVCLCHEADGVPASLTHGRMLRVISPIPPKVAEATEWQTGYLLMWCARNNADHPLLKAMPSLLLSKPEEDRVILEFDILRYESVGVAATKKQGKILFEVTPLVMTNLRSRAVN